MGTDDATDALSNLKLIVRVILILGATATAAAVAFVLRIVVVPLDRGLGRAWLESCVVSGWVEAVLGGFCFPSGCALRLSGQLPRRDHAAAILLANHQLDTDWLYLWEVLRVVGTHGILKIVLLREMRSMPLVGWLMELVGFVFVSGGNKGRSGDAEAIRVAARRLAERPCVLLVFPEGTTVNVESKARSEAFAVKVGRPSQSLLVVPRSAGLAAAIRGFVEGGVPLEDVVIYDATLAYAGYSGEVPAWKLGFERARDVELPNVARLLRGQPGRFVRVHCDAFRASDLVRDVDDVERGLVKWLDDRWTLKNTMLQTFAVEEDFGPECGHVVQMVPRKRIGPLAGFTALWTAGLASLTVTLCLSAAILFPFVLALAVFTLVVFAPLTCCAVCACSPLIAAALTVAFLLHSSSPTAHSDQPPLAQLGRDDAFVDLDENEDEDKLNTPDDTPSTAKGAATSDTSNGRRVVRVAA